MTGLVATISPATPISELIDIVRINGAFGNFEEILSIIQRARNFFPPKKIIIDLPMGRKKTRTSTFSDLELLKFCLENQIDYVSISYVKNAQEITDLQAIINQFSQNFKPQIIAKIETAEAIKNLDSIIKEAGMVMIDRRDLATAVGIEEIPLAQKLIIEKCKIAATKVIVASEALLSMIHQPEPSIADSMDLASSVSLGADYIMLSEETAIGKYPLEVVQTVKQFVQKLENGGFIQIPKQINPHGGILINRVLSEVEKKEILENAQKYPHIIVTEEELLDIDKIAIGTYSPLEGFLNHRDLESVLDNFSLSSGIFWPIPILLNVDLKTSAKLRIGDRVILCAPKSQKSIAILNLEEKYQYNLQELAKKTYNTTDPHHPGVFKTLNLKSHFLGGKINLLERPKFLLSSLEMTPQETRNLFEQKQWNTITAFHTRNIVHRAHEYLQRCAMEITDGLFISPIIKTVNEKWPERLAIILDSYQKMIQNYYPQEKICLAPILTYSRYAGPREALFTAILRKNYGCTHFIIGRDHCGVQNYYDRYAAQELCLKYQTALGINLLLFRGPFYCRKCGTIVSEKNCGHAPREHIEITGFTIADLLKKNQIPSSELIRPEVLQIIISKNQHEELFNEK